MGRLIFLDTANIGDIKKWKARGICDGITTNQKLFLQAGNVDFKKTILEICRITKVPISVELTRHESIAEMVKEARLYASWHKNCVVKVPMTLDGMGLDVLYKLNKLRIKTNATLMVSFEQMILAIKAGSTYVSIFFNRSKDAGYDPSEIIKRSRNFIDEGRYTSKIITGSIRKIRDVGDAFTQGSNIVTVPPKILDEMLREQMTQKTVKEFDAAWKAFQRK